MYSIFTSLLEKIKGKEVEAMKRALSILIAVTMVISTSGLSLAFVSLDSETYPASSGTVGGTPSVTVPFNASLKNISGDTGATSVAWGTITGGVTSWLAANQYIAVEGFTTFSDWGIQIYTNNTSYMGTGEPAGLINIANPIYSLPMSWRTKTDKLSTGDVELEINQETVGGYVVLDDGITPDDQYYPWFFMLDKNTDMDPSTIVHDPFGDYQKEATFIGSDGYHHAPGDVNFATPMATDTVYYVYLGANFTMAIPGATYSTDAGSLTVEMYRL